MRKIILFSTILLLFLFTNVYPVSAIWFQTVGGDVHSNGDINMGIFSIPVPYFSLDTIGARFLGSSGVITHDPAGTVDVGLGSETADQPPGTGMDWVRPQINDQLAEYNFGYFERLLVPDSVTIGGNMCHGLTARIYRINGTLNIDCPGVGSRFDPIGNDRQLIFLVTGDINIRSEMDIGPEEFVIFISQGSITFDSALGGTVDDPAVEGVFIADGNISTSTGATPLFAEGVFIAHGNPIDLIDDFNLERNSGDAVPSETFIHNPSLLLNMPRELRENFGSFREIAP